MKHQSTEIDLKYNGSSNCKTKEALYLGMKFDKKFSWKKHNEIDRAWKRLTVTKDLLK